MKKETIRNQLKCGGSPEMISALSRRMYGISVAVSAIVVLVLIFAGCSVSDNGGASGTIEPAISQVAVSGTLPGSEYVGKTWEHTQVDARISVLSIHMDDGFSYFGAGIAINGSLLITANIDLNVFEQVIATSSDWKLLNENVEIMQR